VKHQNTFLLSGQLPITCSLIHLKKKLFYLLQDCPIRIIDLYSFPQTLNQPYLGIGQVINNRYGVKGVNIQRRGPTTALFSGSGII
jgi:hypothetical protein